MLDCSFYSEVCSLCVYFDPFKSLKWTVNIIKMLVLKLFIKLVQIEQNIFYIIFGSPYLTLYLQNYFHVHYIIVL